MKVILSRKGFDSSYGGQPSPILPDGTLLSLPIPSKDDETKYTDLIYQNKSYYDIIKELKPNSKIKLEHTCHLDPDIRHDSIERSTDWKGLFGQIGSAQGHLKNENIQIGDIFIFFGWFKETEIVSNYIRYKFNSPDLHVIFGYLQIGNIFYSFEQLPDTAKYHPHARKFSYNKNNCIYEASDTLSFDENIPGFGCLRFKDSLILTKPGENRSHWNLPEFFRSDKVKITYHSNESYKTDYFQSAQKGQEFVIENNDKVIDWVKNIIKQ